MSTHNEYQLFKHEHCDSMTEIPQIINVLWSRYIKEQYDIICDDFWDDEDYGPGLGGIDYSIWNWIYDGNIYILYDINTWPGDNVDGVVYIEYDGKHHRIYDNNDDSLSVYTQHEIGNKDFMNVVIDHVSIFNDVRIGE